MTTNYTEVKTAMLLHLPFFASLLLDVMDVRVGKFPEKFGPMANTAATDGRTIWFDEDWLGELTVQEGVFVCCHEIGHAMWDHLSRAKRYRDLGFDGKAFSPLLWNCAADYVINDMLVKCGLSMPVDKKTGKIIGLHEPAKYTFEMGVEEVYRLLLQGAKMQSQDGAGEDGSGQPGFDKHIHEHDKISPAEMKRAVQSAVDTAKACGALPGALKRFAEELIESKIPWQEKLRHIVTSRSSRDTSTWARPHKRRLAHQKMYLARPSSYGCGTIVWVFDTSGSIGAREMTVFASEGAEIMRSCRPERVILIGCDSAVASVTEFAGDEELTAEKLQVGGGGGTDFRPPFEWLEEHGIVPDALIYFTDMYGPFPEPQSFPVIWAATTDVAAPHGDLVRVEIT